MDKKELLKELTEEVTRESLIAISYPLPDKNLTAEKLLKHIDCEGVVEPLIFDDDDIYRSKLISLSYYSPSPDVKAVPRLPGEFNG